MEELLHVCSYNKNLYHDWLLKICIVMDLKGIDMQGVLICVMGKVAGAGNKAVGETVSTCPVRLEGILNCGTDGTRAPDCAVQVREEMKLL